MTLYPKNYIDDPDDVKNITDDLMICTLDKLTVPGHNTIDVGKNLLHSMFLPCDKPQELCFGELLNLFRVSYLHDNALEWMGLIRIFFAWTANVIGTVKLFAAISVKSLADMIDQRSGTERGNFFFLKIYEKLHMYFNFDMTRTTTVGQLFSLLEPSMTQWNPPQPLDDFAHKAYVGCEIIKMMMIDLFRFGYSEFFVLSKLKDKLAADCDDWSGYYYDAEFGNRFDITDYDFDVFATRSIPVENQQQ